jgi:hypothetical protein
MRNLLAKEQLEQELQELLLVQELVLVLLVLDNLVLEL